MATTAPPPTKTVTLTIDGRELTVPEGTTISPPEEDGGDPQDPEDPASQ